MILNSVSVIEPGPVATELLNNLSFDGGASLTTIGISALEDVDEMTKGHFTKAMVEFEKAFNKERVFMGSFSISTFQMIVNSVNVVTKHMDAFVLRKHFNIKKYVTLVSCSSEMLKTLEMFLDQNHNS